MVVYMCEYINHSNGKAHGRVAISAGNEREAEFKAVEEKQWEIDDEHYVFVVELSEWFEIEGVI